MAEVSDVDVADFDGTRRTVPTLKQLMDLLGALSASAYAGSGDPGSLVALWRGVYNVLAAISGYVDGLETLIGSSNTKLDTLHTDLATTLGGKLDTLHADLATTLAAYVDGLETLIGSTNTKLDALHTDLTSATPAGTNVIGKVGMQVGGADVSVTAPVPVGNARLNVATAAAIASGNALSGAIDLRDVKLLGIELPSGWTTALLTFQGSIDNATFYDVYDQFGNEYTLGPSGGFAASKHVLLNMSDFMSFPYIKIRSGTTGSPVNQGSSVSLPLILQP